MPHSAIQLITRPYELELRHPFTISRGTITHQPTLIVELNDGTHRGFGEATANDYYDASVDNIRSAVESVRDLIERDGELDPESLHESITKRIPEESFACCAIDQAAWDLWGKQRGQRLFEVWGYDAESIPSSNFTIGIDTPDVMVQKLKEMPGWPAYKIKVGTPDDLQIVRRLREHTDAAFRVDANCGWTAEQTIELSQELKTLGVEFIEQPLPANDRDGSRRVFQESALPIMADESCICESDVDRCEGLFHGVNIKLVKCGGLTPARRMIVRARELGMKVMVGCMTESTVGISAIAQLLPMLDYVDMDGAALLARDIATGATLEQGECHFSDLAGTGVSLA